MDKKKRLLYIRIIAIIAILVSGYLVYEHYRTTPSEFCVIGEGFNCDIVNKSPYAEIGGIFYFLNFDLGLNVPLPNLPLPISGVSILIFLSFVLMTYTIQKKQKFFNINPKNQIKLLKWLIVLSIVFALYLVYIEAFVLLNWCIYCLTLDVLILAEAILIKDLN